MSRLHHIHSSADPRDWHWADIKAALEKAGYSLSSLSKANGFKTRRAVGMAKDHPYPRMERIIAKAIGVPPKLIWPSRYDENGCAIRKRVTPKSDVAH
jgi:Ner family transcriptional regulator